MASAPTVQRIFALLARRGWRLVTAESCTGGLLSAAITAVPGASGVYHGGWVTYANEAKARELGVPRELMEAGGSGAVSREVAGAMAAGGIAASGADVCVSVTGIAGPDGGTPQKPVGTVWLGLATRDGVRTRMLHLSGDRDAIREAAVDHALRWLEESLASEG